MRFFLGETERNQMPRSTFTDQILCCIGFALPLACATAALAKNAPVDPIALAGKTNDTFALDQALFKHPSQDRNLQPSSRGVVVLAMTGPQAQASPVGDDDFLTPRISIGEHISNVFSIASSVQADGFDERVGRNSGSADYTLTQTSPGPVFTFVTDGFYDGASKYHAVDIIRDGGATSCFDGKCAIYTDASGPLYNRLLWGDPPAHLKAGMTWSVTIRQPWELGPAGDQTVTVMHVDDTDGTVTLKREGSAIGTFAGEPVQIALTRNGKQVTLDVTPGTAKWTGYTTFRHGIVLNDELLVVRTDRLHSRETGFVTATKRRYMLLNAAPYPTL